MSERKISYHKISLIFSIGLLLSTSMNLLDHHTRSEKGFNDYTDLCGKVTDLRKSSNKGVFQGWRLVISDDKNYHIYILRHKEVYMPILFERPIIGKRLCIRQLNGKFLMNPFQIKIWNKEKNIVTSDTVRKYYFSGPGKFTYITLSIGILFLLIYLLTTLFIRRKQ